MASHQVHRVQLRALEVRDGDGGLEGGVEGLVLEGLLAALWLDEVSRQAASVDRRVAALDRRHDHVVALRREGGGTSANRVTAFKKNLIQKKPNAKKKT